MRYTFKFYNVAVNSATTPEPFGSFECDCKLHSEALVIGNRLCTLLSELKSGDWDYTWTSVPEPFKKGIYETNYGNAAYVGGPKAKSAWDLDMQERCPISMVTKKFLRAARPGDAPAAKY